MASPTTPILDDFNRANGALGPNWTQAVNAYSMPLIVSNAMDWPQFPSAAWATPYLPSQEVRVKANAVTAVYFLCRFNNLNTGAENGYVIYSDIAGGTSCEGFKWSSGNGTQTSMGFDAAAISPTDTCIWVNATGTLISLYGGSDGVNYTLRKTWVDGTYTGGGSIGVYQANNGLPTSLDNFGGGNVNPPLASDTPFPPLGRGATW